MNKSLKAEVRDHVWCFQTVPGAPKPPFIAKFIAQLGSPMTGKAKLRLKSGQFIEVHRGACSTHPFDPDHLDKYREEMRTKLNLQAKGKAATVDPISGALIHD